MPALVSCEDAIRFFEFAPDLCCVLQPDGRVVSANPAAERNSGYSNAELRNLSVLDLIHPDDQAGFDRTLQDLSAGSHTAETETRFRTADGSYRWFLWSANAVDGRVVVTAHDITEKRNLHEERFRRLFESAKDCIVIADARSGEILECNRHTSELFGYPQTELRGKKIWEAAPFEVDAVGRRLFDELQHSQTFRSEEELKTRDGDTISCELLCNRYREGSSEMLQANIRDVSERKRADAALRESEERFRLLVEGVRDYAMFMTDTGGRIVSWNRGAEKILGYSENEAIGTDSALLFTPEDREGGEPLREMETALREGRAQDERWHLRKDGTRFFASGVLTPVWRGENDLHGFAKIMRDITEKKTQEEAMREAQKLESIGLLAGGVAHDFNNLLTGIIGNASLASDDLPAGHPVRRLIDEVITAGKRAADLTRQLLAYAGKGTFTIETFSISDAVGEILDLIHASIPERVRLELELDPDVPSIEADATQIQQIAMNLVINAAEAIHGDGLVRITTSWKRFSEQDLRNGEGLAHLRRGDYVLLQVEDTGIGMDEETKARIFDPFFTTKFTGRGLGLAAVAGIVRGHGGAIRVFTAPQQGSSFEVYLPAAHIPAKPWKKKEPVSHERGSETILVVDDDSGVRQISRDALERRGYHVMTADNGHQAVEIFRRNRSAINLVILDLAMPVMSGEEAHRIIKEIRPDVPIIVSSGYSELIASSRFGRRGMEAFIQKPYTAPELVTRVQKAFAQHRNRDGAPKEVTSGWRAEGDGNHE